MSHQTLISYAQNGEDVVLWRALSGVDRGIYVDVGGWDPDVDSVTRLFYDRGWRGVDIEPVPDLAQKFRTRRPYDEVVEAVIVEDAQDHVVLHRFGSSGLSTIDDDIAERHQEAGLDREDISVPARRLDDVLAESSLVEDTIHFLKVDVEGAEKQVLGSIDLDRWRPWVLVIEATEPNSTVSTHEHWESIVLAAGYTFTLFDGLSRFYVSPAHPELAEQLSYPACPLDGFESARELELRASVEAQERELHAARQLAMRWRNEAVGYWARAVAQVQTSEEAAAKARDEARRLRRQLGKAKERLDVASVDRRRMRVRIRRLSDRLTALESRPDQRRPATRARNAVRRMTRR